MAYRGKPPLYMNQMAQRLVKDARTLIAINIAFHELASHLHANAEHGLGHFNMLALQEDLGIFRKRQGDQRTFIIGPAQLDPPVRQLDNF